MVFILFTLVRNLRRISSLRTLYKLLSSSTVVGVEIQSSSMLNKIKKALAEFIPNHVVGFDYCLLNSERTS